MSESDTTLIIKAIGKPEKVDAFYAQMMEELGHFKTVSGGTVVNEFFDIREDCSGRSLAATLSDDNLSIIKVAFEACAKMWVAASQVFDQVAIPQGDPAPIESRPHVGNVQVGLTINFYVAPPNSFNANLKTLPDIPEIRNKLDQFMEEMVSN